ncbi:MAG: (d)CMP kinase [Bdellovibrionales bacterium]
MTQALTPKVITIDGPSASGKTTLIRTLAAELGCPHLSGGKVLRKFVYEQRKGTLDGTPESLKALVARPSLLAELDDPALEGDEIGLEMMRTFSSLESVKPVVEFHRQLAALHPVIIVDGRIAGTQVFPDACMKFFLHASLDARAARRGSDAAKEGLLKRDAAEAAAFGADNVAPAKDAIVINTDDMSPVDVHTQCLEQIRLRLG